MKKLLLLTTLACTTPMVDEVAHSTLLTSTPRTFLLILTDDQRVDLFTREVMPLTFNALVDSGTLYTNTHANTPVCCPMRATLFTGLYQSEHNVLDNFGPSGGAPAFNPNATIATELQAQGVLTALHGKYLNQYNKLTQFLPPGWSEWRVPVFSNYWNYILNSKPFDSSFRAISFGSLAKDHNTNVLKRASRDLILRTPINQDLFLIITPLAPHKPWTAQLSDIGSCNHLTPFFQIEQDVSDKPDYVQNQPAISATQLSTLTADWKKQCETLQSVDRLVEEVMNALRQTGRIHNSVIAYTSDNSLLMGEHRLYERKHSIYATHVPFVLRTNGIAAIINTPISLIDLSATMRDYFNLNIPHGISLLSSLPSEVLFEHRVLTPENEHFTGIREGDWLYAFYPKGKNNGPFEELYNLSTDPGMLVNRSNDSTVSVIKAHLITKLP